MNNKIIISAVIVAILLLVLYYNRHTIGVNRVVFLTIKRGIISNNCFWWSIADLFGDHSGVERYNTLIEYHYPDNRFIPTNIFGTRVYIVTQLTDIKKMLNASPYTFGVGRLKLDFFKSFMRYNVGVSEGCPWKKRRELNEYVLNSDKPHRYEDLFKKSINELINELGPPRNFDQFSYFGKRLAMRIVFNIDEIYDPIFDMLSEANSVNSIIFGSTSIDKETEEKYFQYLENSIKNPKEGSLIYLAREFLESVDKGNKEVYKLNHQIPHWIFPIAGAPAVACPRLLILLFNHHPVLKKVLKEISTKPANRYTYLRKCILELFRLNNPVNSTFRTLLKDFDFGDSEAGNYLFKKGEQFLVLNNPVMREPEKFKDPNRFIPERWTPELEESYWAIMFNQGPQKCPGKELVIFIIERFVTRYLQDIDVNKINFYPKLDTSNIIQMINHCKIKLDLVH